MNPDAKLQTILAAASCACTPSLINSVRGFREQLHGLQVEHEYIEKPRLDHGTIMLGAMPTCSDSFPSIGTRPGSVRVLVRAAIATHGHQSTQEL